MSRLLVLVAASVACGGASDRSRPSCPPAPSRDGVTSVATLRLDDRCVVLADAAGRGILDRWPAVSTWTDDRWSHARLDRFRGYHWRGSALAGDDVVGVLDSAVEAPGWELLIIASGDGSNWEVRGRLRKVYYFATVADVTADRGDLVITIELDDDYGAGVTPGTYRYRSHDVGRTWSPPALFESR